MARTTIGKQFEAKFRENWTKSFPGDFVYRLPDQVSGNHGSTNPCDFICYGKPTLFLIECKETAEGTLNWSKFPQYSRLLAFKHIEGLVPGVVVWYSNYDEVRFVHIKDCEQMHKDGKKSISLSELQKGLYNSISIPSVKLQKFMNSDYTILKEVYGGN